METYRTGTERSGETVNPLSSTRREALLSHILKSRERIAGKIDFSLGYDILRTCEGHK